MGTLASIPHLLYEDGLCFVLNKPSGLHSVALPDSDSPSLAAVLTATEPGLAHASEKVTDGGLVQRLDQETSGVILGAKTRPAWDRLRKALNDGEIEKSYMIVTEGEFPSQLELNNFIGTPNRRARKVKVYTSKPAKSERALPARTTFERLAFDPSRSISLVRAFAPTARRHQVRAHAAFRKHPLVGDSLYGASRELPALLGVSPLPQFLLHAEALTFPSPETGERVHISAPTPEAMRTLFPSYPVNPR